MMKSFRFAPLLVAAAAIAGCGKVPSTFSDQFDPVEMQQAIQTAQSGFDQFMARARNPQPGDEAFSVKVKLTDSKGTEHIWLTDPKFDKLPWTGTISMDAEILKNVYSGQTCMFKREEVTDWMYRANGKVEGNFTLRVLLKSMPKEEADALKAKMGW